MDSARTAWAEGTGLDTATVEALTVISEEAGRRAADDCGFESGVVLLPPGDIGAWAPELDACGFGDLADRVRALGIGS